MEVVSNTGLIMLTVTISSSIYLYFVFRKDFKIEPDLAYLDNIKPLEYLKSKKELVISLLILLTVILTVIFKEFIANKTGLRLDNGSITLF
jgi:Na+/H+ antiporter NhaD/arsenite permease-like protein